MKHKDILLLNVTMIHPEEVNLCLFSLRKQVFPLALVVVSLPASATRRISASQANGSEGRESSCSQTEAEMNTHIHTLKKEEKTVPSLHSLCAQCLRLNTVGSLFYPSPYPEITPT